MKKIGLVLFGLGLLFSPPLHAQTTHLTPAIITIAAAAAPQTDPIAFSNAPMVGLFYSAQNPDLPPAPSDFANLPVWDLGDGNYLLDDFDSDLRRQSGIGGAVQDDSPPTPPGDGGSGGSPSTNGISYSFDTNGLWLEMVDVSTNGYADLNLHNATNQIYAIWGTSDLTGGWTALTEVWPTNASIMPFTVPLTNQQTLFMQAEDWTGVTENGNTTPDWWFWEYFGTTALSDTNLDSQGNTLLSDYQNGIDPNVINFSVNVTNQYVNCSSPPAMVTVTAGVPYYYSVLVDNTNQADANWIPYTSSTIAINLNGVAGWHRVLVGLKGLPLIAQQTWDCLLMDVEMTPPSIVVTNPAVGAVTTPMIQLQGYSTEALLSLSYNLSNASGVWTNRPGYVIDQQFDTGSTNGLAFGFGTNYFQCFGIPLASGTNLITLFASDLAGNTATTNLVYVLVPNTNPPIINLQWPQDGTSVSGNNCTIRGMLSDPFATITAQAVNSGLTNTLIGLVELTGSFWIQNVPLGSGTNYLSIISSNANGYETITNIGVIQSSQTLTIDSFTFNAPQSPTATVICSFGDSNAVVTVNGIQATNNGGGTWTAQYVPTGDSSTVVFSACATSDGSPASGEQVEDETANISGIVLAEYMHIGDYKSPEISSNIPGVHDRNTYNWNYGAAGTSSLTDCYTSPGEDAYQYNLASWDATCNGTFTAGGSSSCGQPDPNPSSGPVFEFPAQFQGESGEWANVDQIQPSQGQTTPSIELTYQGFTLHKLYTGGSLGSRAQRLWALSADAYGEGTWPYVPPVSTTLIGQTLPASGTVYALLYDNSSIDVEPQVTGGNTADWLQVFSDTLSLQPLIVSNGNRCILTSNYMTVKTLTNNFVYVQATLTSLNNMPNTGHCHPVIRC